MIFTTLLNPSYDLIYTIPNGDKSTYLDVPASLFPAGKGLNCAKVIARLGEPVTLLSLMPRDDSARFSAYLEEYGVTHTPYEIPGSVRINTTIFERETQSTTHYNSAGAKLSTRIQDHYLSFLQERMDSGDKWVFSGSLPAGIEENFYGELIRSCREKGVTPLVDTRGKALEYSLKAVPTVITPNEEEIEYISEEPVEGIQHLALKGKRLIDSGISTVFITLGEDGVIALNKNECILCKAPEIEQVDTVGCGDAFMAGVTVGMERGFSFHEICRLAVACGASNAAHLGPGEVDRDQVWHLMEEVKVASL